MKAATVPMAPDASVIWTGEVERDHMIYLSGEIGVAEREQVRAGLLWIGDAVADRRMWCKNRPGRAVRNRPFGEYAIRCFTHMTEVTEFGVQALKATVMMEEALLQKDPATGEPGLDGVEYLGAVYPSEGTFPAVWLRRRVSGHQLQTGVPAKWLSRQVRSAVKDTYGQLLPPDYVNPSCADNAVIHNAKKDIYYPLAATVGEFNVRQNEQLATEFAVV